MRNSRKKQGFSSINYSSYLLLETLHKQHTIVKNEGKYVLTLLQVAFEQGTLIDTQYFVVILADSSSSWHIYEEIASFFVGCFLPLSFQHGRKCAKHLSTDTTEYIRQSFGRK